jgi:hypothetical protein
MAFGMARRNINAQEMRQGQKQVKQILLHRGTCKIIVVVLKYQRFQ